MRSYTNTGSRTLWDSSRLVAVSQDQVVPGQLHSREGGCLGTLIGPQSPKETDSPEDRRCGGWTQVLSRVQLYTLKS